MSTRALSRTLTATGAAAALALTLTAPATAASRSFPETVPLPSGSSPEGIAGGKGNAFFAGSRNDGSIVKGDLRTGRSQPFVPGRSRGQAAVGMQYDPGTDRLWVAGGGPGARTGLGTVTAYDGTTGERVFERVVEGAGFLNDVAITKDAVYVTDSFRPVLVQVPLGPGGALPDDVVQQPLTGDFRQPDGFGLNGVRALPGGDLVAVSSSGGLFRVETSDFSTDRVEVRGGDETGGDGLELVGSTLYVVYAYGQDQVASFRLGPDARYATFRDTFTEPAFDRPTTATFAAGRLWAVNGRFDEPDAPTTEYQVVRVDLR